MEPAKLNFRVYQGSTFLQQLRWESETKTYIPIINITKTAPVQVEVSLDLIQNLPPVGWRARISGVQGMKEINMPEDTYEILTNKDFSTVEFNSINSTQYSNYTSGGTLSFNTPVSINNYTARMQIRKKLKDDDILLELTTENGGIVLDDITKTITIKITAEQTSLFNFSAAVYDLEFIQAPPGDRIIRFAQGSLILSQEVTR